MEGDTFQITRWEAIRILQETNRLRMMLSHSSMPAIMLQEVAQDIERWKIILEDNGYKTRLDNQTPWGTYVFCCKEEQHTEKIVAVRPKVTSESLDDLLDLRNFPACPTYNYHKEINHCIEVISSLSAQDAREALQLIILSVSILMKKRVGSFN
jgi:hypothetical protein